MAMLNNQAASDHQLGWSCDRRKRLTRSFMQSLSGEEDEEETSGRETMCFLSSRIRV